MCSGGGDYVKRNPYEEELMRVSEKRFEEYKDIYLPLENQMMEQIQGYRGAGYQQSMTDKGVNAARMQSPSSITVGAGMQPGGGNFAEQAQGVQEQAGTAGAMGAMSGLQTAEDQYMSGMMGMSQLGRNQQATAMQGTGQLASMQAGTDMAELSAQQYARNQMWGAGGAMAGMGMVYHGNKKGWFNKNKSNPNKWDPNSTGVWQDL